MVRCSKFEKYDLEGNKVLVTEEGLGENYGRRINAGERFVVTNMAKYSDVTIRGKMKLIQLCV